MHTDDIRRSLHTCYETVVKPVIADQFSIGILGYCEVATTQIFSKSDLLVPSGLTPTTRLIEIESACDGTSLVLNNSSDPGQETFGAIATTIQRRIDEIRAEKPRTVVAIRALGFLVPIQRRTYIMAESCAEPLVGK